MNFKSASGSWSLESFNMSYDAKGNGTSGKADMAPMDARFIKDTPLDFSYHCYQGGKINQTGANSTDSACLVFTSLQVWLLCMLCEKDYCV